MKVSRTGSRMLAAVPVNLLVLRSISLIVFIWAVLQGAVPSMASEQVVVKGSVVNLRAGPGTGNSIVGSASRGDVLEVMTSRDGWYKVVKNGVACWIAGWLVELKQAPQTTYAGILPPSGVGSAVSGSGGSGSTASVAEVTGSIVNIRSGPGTGYGITGKAVRGDRFDVIGSSGGWYKIKTGSSTGWIIGQYVKVAEQVPVKPVESNVPKPAGAQAVINGSLVNIRSGPGTGYQVVSRAGQGERFNLVGRADDWYQVVLDNGRTGWVVSWLVDVNEQNGGSQVRDSQNNDNSGEQPAEKPAGGNVTPGSGAVPVPVREDGGSVSESTPVVLKSVSATSAADKTILTVTSEGGQMDSTITTMVDPLRLVIDLKNARPGTVPENVNFKSLLVSGIRVGWYQKDPDVTRVVVDLNNSVKYEKYISDNGSKLQILISSRLKKSLQGATIVLDAGHGGSDPGAIGPTGLKEKDVNLAITLETARLLREKGATVLLTRTGDEYVDLYNRPEIGNNNGADLFVSIHSNASNRSDYGGTTTYHRRTEAEGMGDLRNEGVALAEKIQNRLAGSLGIVDRGVLQADFVVIARSQAPAALAEVAFISNPQEERMLKDEAFRFKAASAIALGIADYFN